MLERCYGLHHARLSDPYISTSERLDCPLERRKVTTISVTTYFDHDGRTFLSTGHAASSVHKRVLCYENSYWLLHSSSLSMYIRISIPRPQFGSFKQSPSQSGRVPIGCQYPGSICITLYTILRRNFFHLVHSRSRSTTALHCQPPPDARMLTPLPLCRWVFLPLSTRISVPDGLGSLIRDVTSPNVALLGSTQFSR